jgi:hypothetical protein
MAQCGIASSHCTIGRQLAIRSAPIHIERCQIRLIERFHSPSFSATGEAARSYRPGPRPVAIYRGYSCTNSISVPMALCALPGTYSGQRQPAGCWTTGNSACNCRAPGRVARGGRTRRRLRGQRSPADPPDLRSRSPYAPASGAAARGGSTAARGCGSIVADLMGGRVAHRRCGVGHLSYGQDNVRCVRFNRGDRAGNEPSHGVSSGF